MFEPIADDDVPAMVALMNRAYRGIGASGGWTTETAYLAGERITDAFLRADLAATPAGAFLKWVDPGSGAILGCVWLEKLGEDSWYLGSLATEPALQNAGLGKRLLGAAEDWVAARGGAVIRMTVVNVRDALIAWYVRRGYRLTGATAPFPYGDDRFGTPLRDDLSFVILEKRLV